MGYKEVFKSIEKRLLIARSMNLDDIMEGDIVEITMLPANSKEILRVGYIDGRSNPSQTRPGLQKPAGMYLTKVNYDFEGDRYVSLDFGKTKTFLAFHLYGETWVARLIRETNIDSI